jgi:hypothetical protein
MLTADVSLGADVAAGENIPGLFFSESFDDPNLAGRGWYDGNKFKISEKDACAGKGCIEYRWKKNSTSPITSAGVRRLIEPTEVVYLRFYIRLSDGWGWSGRSYHPHMMHFLTTENSKYHGPAASHLTLYIEPVNGKLRLAATDIQNKDAPHGLTQGPLRGGYNGRHYDSEEALFDDAKWHCIEAMFKLNSLDMKNDKPNSDGRLRGWFDGKLVVERNDVVFRSTDFPEMKFNQFLLLPYFGPGLLPHEQTLWIDELAVGNQRIGRFGRDPHILTPKPSDKHRREGGKDVRGTGFQPVKTQPRWPRHLPQSSGEYLGHEWHIDENHLMWWDGKPYIPFGGFGITPGNEFELNTFNLWIDFDPFIEKPQYTRKQHRADIARKLGAISKVGGTCIVQFSMALPHIPEGPKPGMRWREPEGGIDGSRLADPEVKRGILKVWEYYAPAVRKECVRAIVLWNEINVWRWPERMSVDKYGQVLSEYAREVKRMVGDLPVCFKVVGTWNAAAVIAGAAAADGLGFDVWFTKPDDARAQEEIERALWMLEGRQKKTTWFFIAEGGRGITEGGTDEAKDVENYWDNWPPLRSKTEAQGILRAYVRSGAKGFIYNGPTSELGSNYRSSYRWLGELKPEIVDLMVTMKRPSPEER